MQSNTTSLHTHKRKKKSNSVRDQKLQASFPAFFFFWSPLLGLVACFRWATERWMRCRGWKGKGDGAYPHNP